MGIQCHRLKELQLVMALNLTVSLRTLKEHHEASKAIVGFYEQDFLVFCVCADSVFMERGKA